MSVLVNTGAPVAPGDTLYISYHGPDVVADSTDDVTSGEGCYVRHVASREGGGSEQHIVSSKVGLAQWDGSVVSVYQRSSVTQSQVASGSAHRSGMAEGISGSESHSPAFLATSTSVFGPRLGDVVHIRITRVARLFAFGEIIAVNSTWCSSGSGTGGFRGVLRVEDIRPFRPTKDQLQPPPPSQAYTAGDVVMAEVISQSDVRQYQLSTLAERFGVIESVVFHDNCNVKLKHIPGRRDVMLNPITGTLVSRWCPLIPVQ